jgi:predicted oxidoreductase
LGLFNYENVFDFFLAESDFKEFNALSKAVQELRGTLNDVNQAKGETAKAAAFDHLLRHTTEITNIIDTKAIGHIDEYYEEICHYQDSGIDCAA